MRTKRSMESQDFRKNRTSGHLYAALAMQAGEPMDVGPTVVVKDYPAADDQMGVINQGVLTNEKCKELQKWDKWDQELGLVAFNAQTPPDARGEKGLKHHEVMQEFWARFKDGVFHLAADKQFDEQAAKIEGGYLKPYKNVLFFNEFDQKTSIVAIKNAVPYFKACPFASDVVTAVRSALQANIPKYKDLQLVPAELTFFLGVSTSSCTKWHTDSEEHDQMVLELTTLTLLSQGTTSMCIAGCKETELKEPFDTVVFDPELYHRSGLTYPHVMKLSIHWTLRSGTGQAGSSGVKAEAKPQPPLVEEVPVPDEDVRVGAQLEALAGKEGPEAEQEIEKLLAANAQNPNRNEDKPDSENEHIEVVKRVPEEEKVPEEKAPEEKVPEEKVPEEKVPVSKARGKRKKGA